MPRGSDHWCKLCVLLEKCGSCPEDFRLYEFLGHRRHWKNFPCTLVKTPRTTSHWSYIYQCLSNHSVTWANRALCPLFGRLGLRLLSFAFLWCAWPQRTLLKSGDPRAKPSMSLNGDQGTYTLSFEAVWKFTTKTSIGHALEEIPCQDVKEPYQYYFYKYYKKAALSVYLSTFNSCINAE